MQGAGGHGHETFRKPTSDDAGINELAAKFSGAAASRTYVIIRTEGRITGDLRTG
jgi:hypothetical protein